MQCKSGLSTEIQDNLERSSSLPDEQYSFSVCLQKPA